jgi:hypothetical protein
VNRPIIGLATLLSFAVLGSSVVTAGTRTAALEWTAPGDDGYIGTARSYEIRFSRLPITTSNFLIATRLNTVKVPGPAGSKEHLTILGLTSGVGYYFGVVGIDDAGNRSPVSNITFLHSDVAGVDGSPGDVVNFSAPFPNPAVSTTRFAVSLAQPNWVRIEAFDIEGRKVRTLAMGQYSAGHFDMRWDLRDDFGRSLEAGTYLVRSQIGDSVFLRRVTVVG